MPALPRTAAPATLAALAAGCSPRPPSTTAPPASGSPAESAAPGGTAVPSPTATPLPSTQPIKAISRGSGDDPARYIERNPQGRIQYEVRSVKVVYDRANDATSAATFTKPHVIFHDDKGKTMVADAPEAVAHDRDKSVTMTGGVRAKTDDGMVLTCDTLTYDAKADRVSGTGHVLLTNTRTGQSATGSQLDSDLSFEHLTLSGNP